MSDFSKIKTTGDFYVGLQMSFLFALKKKYGGEFHYLSKVPISPFMQLMNSRIGDLTFYPAADGFGFGFEMAANNLSTDCRDAIPDLKTFLNQFGSIADGQVLKKSAFLTLYIDFE